MLINTYEPTQSTHKNNSTDSINPINQLNIYAELFWKTFDFVDLFKDFLLTQSPINSLGKVPTGSIQSILWKKINRFKSINSIEMIRIQVWFLDTPKRLSFLANIYHNSMDYDSIFNSMWRARMMIFWLHSNERSLFDKSWHALYKLFRIVPVVRVSCTKRIVG